MRFNAIRKGLLLGVLTVCLSSTTWGETPKKGGADDISDLDLPGLNPPTAQRPTYPISAVGPSDLSVRINNLETNVAHLEAEVEVLKTQSRMVIRHTHVSFRNATYMSLGMSLLMPRVGTFNFLTDSGLGTVTGVGQYLGRNHVVELDIDWDVYLALSLQYRLEFHTTGSGITWGPVLGYRVKVASLTPFDIKMTGPVRTSFYFLGMELAFPLGGASLLRFQLQEMRNSQEIINVEAGMHFFL